MSEVKVKEANISGNSVKTISFHVHHSNTKQTVIEVDGVHYVVDTNELLKAIENRAFK